MYLYLTLQNIVFNFSFQLPLHACKQTGLSFTLVERILLVQVKMGVNMRVLVVVWRDIEHLQTGDGVIGYCGHPLSVESLSSQPLWVGHFWPQLGPSEGQPLAL